jgi:hypothetical protein
MTIPSSRGRNGDLSITIILLKSECTWYLSRSISPSITQDSRQALFPKSWDEPTGCATCMTFRHRHHRRSRLIETAKLKVSGEGKREIKKLKQRGYNGAEKEVVDLS